MTLKEFKKQFKLLNKKVKKPKLKNPKQKSCSSKVKHKNKESACACLKRMKNAGLTAYYCKWCGSWHLGHSLSEFKVQARLDQLIGKKKQ